MENVTCQASESEWQKNDGRRILLLGICFWRKAPETAVGRTGGQGVVSENLTTARLAITGIHCPINPMSARNMLALWFVLLQSGVAA